MYWCDCVHFLWSRMLNRECLGVLCDGFRALSTSDDIFGKQCLSVHKQEHIICAPSVHLQMLGTFHCFLTSSGHPCYTAIYDYKAAGENQVSFMEGKTMQSCSPIYSSVWGAKQVNQSHCSVTRQIFIVRKLFLPKQYGARSVLFLHRGCEVAK